jgi:hypothetical protein
MSRRPEPADPRLHALRTLAALLARHGPGRPTPPAAAAAAAEPAPANQAEPTRKAA